MFAEGKAGPGSAPKEENRAGKGAAIGRPLESLLLLRETKARRRDGEYGRFDHVQTKERKA